MKALVLYDSTIPVTDYRIAHTVNGLYSVDCLDVQYQLATANAPTVADINSSDFDVIMIGTVTAGNSATYARFIAGSVTKPVLAFGCNTSNTDLKGTSAFSDGAAGFTEGRYTASPSRRIWDNTRRYTLDATLVHPEKATALIEGTDGTSIVAWKYTADGTNYVYYTGLYSRQAPVHFLLQEAVNDGVLNVSKVSRAPLVLSIDHINGGGLFTTGGGTELGGFQFQPDKIVVLGDILRSNNGVCYCDAEQKWILDSGTSPNSGTTTGALLANLQEYNDVLKICATHDHLNEYTTTTKPWIDSRTKSFMEDAYNITKNAIEGIGLIVDTVLATFATNKYSGATLELGSPNISNRSSSDNLTEKAGWGFKVFRSSSNFADCWPQGYVANLSTNESMIHWRKSISKHLGIAILCSRDGGAVNNNTDLFDKLAFNSIGQGFEAINNGTIIYYHHDDFEDVAAQPSGTSTGGLTYTFGLLTWQVMSDYAAMCPDTVDFGADINNYI